MKEETKKICRHCKWYDISSQRDFHRKIGPKNEKGERTEIVEVRAICRNKKVPAHGHLVMDKSERPCFEEGVYKPPKPEKSKKSQEQPKKPNKKKDTDEEKTSPEEYFGTPEERLKLEAKKGGNKQNTRAPEMKGKG